MDLFSAICCDEYANITCPIYTKLMWEFYTTFKFLMSYDSVNIHTPNMVKFCLMGKQFNFLTEFNFAWRVFSKDYVHFDDYLISIYDYSIDFDPISLYKEWSTTEMAYNPSNLKNYALMDTSLKYIHQFLSYSYSRWVIGDTLF